LRQGDANGNELLVKLIPANKGQQRMLLESDAARGPNQDPRGVLAHLAPRFRFYYYIMEIEPLSDQRVLALVECFLRGKNQRDRGRPLRRVQRVHPICLAGNANCRPNIRGDMTDDLAVNSYRSNGAAFSHRCGAQTRGVRDAADEPLRPNGLAVNRDAQWELIDAVLAQCASNAQASGRELLDPLGHCPSQMSRFLRQQQRRITRLARLDGNHARREQAGQEWG
jgi:hypothetical protein